MVPVSLAVSRMSPMTECCVPVKSNKLGLVYGARAYPVTVAPSERNHRCSQAPLKPVCPVRNTRRPRQNSSMGCILAVMISYQSDPASLKQLGEQAHRAYVANSPFPHIVIDNFSDSEILHRILAEELLRLSCLIWLEKSGPHFQSKCTCKFRRRLLTYQ
jgi:hypothetical protein